MKVTVIGGGNIGTLMAADAAISGHSVIMYARDVSGFDTNLEVLDNDKNLLYSTKIDGVTSDLEDAVKDADVLFVTYPAFAFGSLGDKLDKLINEPKMIGIIPGSGGAEFAFKKLIDKGCTLFGFQRVHSIARLNQKGKSVCMLGRKDDISVGVIPQSKAAEVSKLMSDMFKMPCNALPNYLCLTLTPSNPVLHTSRLFTMFENWKPDIVYDRNILFYEEWTDYASEMLILCDGEVQEFCERIPLDLKQVKSLKEHYESDTIGKMTEKIQSIKAFKGLTSPMKKEEDGFVPDFDSRYFTADFSYGLKILIDISELFEVQCPNLKKMWNWYLDYMKYGEKQEYFSLEIKDRQEFVLLYGKSVN